MTGALALAVVASFGGVVLSVSSASASASVTCVDEIASAEAALATAEACDSQVEVSSMKSATLVAYANPDKTMTAVMSPAPVRTLKGSEWVDIDTSLKRGDDGVVSPVATTQDLTLSGGGSGPLLTLGEPGRRISLTWSAGLPAPVLNGDLATYPEVLPGVDLQVRVGDSWYQQLFVVKSAQAAVNPELASLSFDVATEGVSLREQSDGAIEAVDAEGEVVFAASAPSMWASPDPSVVEVAARSGQGSRAVLDALVGTGVVDEPAEPHRVRMEAEVSQSRLTVVPVQELLRSPETIFPVYIDPNFAHPSPTYWTNVMDDNPNHSYFNEYDHYRVGRQWKTSNVWRTHMQFHDFGEMSGSVIVSAKLKATADHTADCDEAKIQLWEAEHITHFYQYTWNTAANGWLRYLDTQTFDANQSSCPTGDETKVFEGALKSAVQTKVSAGANAMTFGLRAASESNYYQWAKFLPNKTALEVQYNRVPKKPVGLSFTTTLDCYLQCSSPAMVRNATPTLRARVQDADGGVLQTAFEIRTAASLSAPIVVESTTMPRSFVTTSGNATATATSQVPAGKLTSGTTYYWHATTKDELGFWSGWGSWYSFTVDTSPPELASVVSSEFPARQWGAEVGTAGSFSLSSAPDAAEFSWQVDAGPVTTVAATGGDPATATIDSFTPATDMVHTLYVRSRDVAGNVSPAAEHQFWVTPVSNRCWNWRLDETSGATAKDWGNQDSADVVCPPIGSSVTAMPGAVSPGVTWTADAERGQVASFDGTGEVATSGAVLDTTKAFTVTAWVKLTDLASGSVQTVVSQAGDAVSDLSLEYRQDANGGAGGFCFTMAASGGELATACAEQVSWPVSEGQWLHVAGVYDATLDVIRAYVMGDPVRCAGDFGEADFTSPRPATGAFHIGRGTQGVDAAPAHHVVGQLSDVYAFQRVLSSSEICQMSAP
ncbi:LamG domain-containing protein [Salinispora tropica]|uniref:LamG domain-containing protein n=1 Tax=Salinispora tropica TaxID=168695 RepID=UPI0012D33D7F